MARPVPDSLKPYQWKPGQSGNPAGSKKGVLGGRSAALRELDAMLAKAENLRVLREALEKDFRKNPMRFFKDVVMPLLPKQAVSQLNSGDRVIEWRGLLTVGGPGNDDGMGGHQPVVDVTDGMDSADGEES